VQRCLVAYVENQQPEWLQKPLVLKDAISDLPPVSLFTSISVHLGTAIFPGGTTYHSLLIVFIVEPLWKFKKWWTCVLEKGIWVAQPICITSDWLPVGLQFGMIRVSTVELISSPLFAPGLKLSRQGWHSLPGWPSHILPTFCSLTKARWIVCSKHCMVCFSNNNVNMTSC
jgi:hypothetical protein